MRQLILAIRKNPCLWKADSKDYKSQAAKETAWNRVVKECCLSDVMSAKMLWKKLRDGYRQALKHKESRRKRTTGFSINTNKRWKYEKLMEFLLPYIVVTYSSSQPRTRDSTCITGLLPNTSQLVPDNDHESDEDKKTDNDEFIYDLAKGSRYTSLDEDNFLKEETTFKDQNIFVFSAVKTFFHSMSQMCEELPEHIQIKVQRSVFNTLMEAREEHLKLQFENGNDPLTYNK